MSRNLPARLFVEIQHDGKDEYFVAHDKADGAAEMGETKTVGIYGLLRVISVKGIPHVTDLGSKRKRK